MSDTPASRLSEAIASMSKMTPRELAKAHAEYAGKGVVADAPAVFSHYNRMMKLADLIGETRFSGTWEKTKEDEAIPF